MTNVIAIDKDDTLNWLTFEIAKKAGITNVSDIPHLDQIKSKNVSDEFLKARTECFNDPDFFLSPPYGHANDLISLAKEYGFKPTICTKTMSKHKFAPEITANKIRFWQQYYPDVNMMIVTGEKEIDAFALIDDSLQNCLTFSQKYGQTKPFLVWDHKTGSIDLINAFYRYCHRLQTLPFFETDDKLSYKLTIRKNEKGLIDVSVVLTDINFLSNQSDQIFIMTDHNDNDFYVFFEDVVSNSEYNSSSFITKDDFLKQKNTTNEHDFYSILFNNLKID